MMRQVVQMQCLFLPGVMQIPGSRLKSIPESVFLYAESRRAAMKPERELR